MTTSESRLHDYTTAANCLRIMGHPSRLAIAVLLLEGPCTVSEIEQKLGLRQPNLSQHLGVLRDAQLLTATRKAKSVTYELADGWPVRRFVNEIAQSYGLGGARASRDATVPAGAVPTARAASSAKPAASSDSGEASIFANVLVKQS